MCLTDIDFCPCVTFAKDRFRNKKSGDLDNERIIVVQKEIESWYLAGLEDVSCEKLGLPTMTCTEELSKEEFNAIVKRGRDKTRMSSMLEMLRVYDLDTAITKNKSLRYLCSKHLKV